MTEDERKEEWIRHYILLSGVQWSDPPPTYEEAELAWKARQLTWPKLVENDLGDYSNYPQSSTLKT